MQTRTLVGEDAVVGGELDAGLLGLGDCGGVVCVSHGCAKGEM